MKETAVYALTRQGAELAKTLVDQVKGALFLPGTLAEDYRGKPFERLKDLVAEQFSAYQRHIFIAAAGIVVRVIAPHIKHKDSDPAVIVLDQRGRHVISLLSGHLGGANELAREVARLTGGKAVITTATDTSGLPSVDLLAKERQLAIGNLDAVKKVNASILHGDPVQLFDPEERMKAADTDFRGVRIERINRETQWDPEKASVWITWRDMPDHRNRLVLHPGCLIGGIGCNRGTDATEILGLIKDTFRGNRLSLQSLHCLTSIKAKQDEPGLLAAADGLRVPVFFYSPSELEGIEVPHPSGIVKRHMGVWSVCEATALIKSKKGRLIVPKIKNKNVTLAVALES